jgi:hypothetical protein
VIIVPSRSHLGARLDGEPDHVPGAQVSVSATRGVPVTLGDVSAWGSGPTASAAESTVVLHAEFVAVTRQTRECPASSVVTV